MHLHHKSLCVCVFVCVHANMHQHTHTIKTDGYVCIYVRAIYSRALYSWRVSYHKGLNQPMWHEMLKKAKGSWWTIHVREYRYVHNLCMCVCVCVYAHHIPSHTKKETVLLGHLWRPPSNEVPGFILNPLCRTPTWWKSSNLHEVSEEPKAFFFSFVLAVMTLVSDSRDDATPSWLGISMDKLNTVTWGRSGTSHDTRVKHGGNDVNQRTTGLCWHTFNTPPSHKKSSFQEVRRVCHPKNISEHPMVFPHLRQLCP